MAFWRSIGLAEYDMPHSLQVGAVTSAFFRLLPQDTNGQALSRYLGGTRASGPMRCGSCRHGTIMRGAAESAERVYCSQIGKFIHLRVVECSGYEDKVSLTLHQLSQMAWILTTRKHSREVGFVRSRDFRKEYKEDILPPEYDYLQTSR